MKRNPRNKQGIFTTVCEAEIALKTEQINKKLQF